MLFRTVYGPELEAVYAFIAQRGAVAVKTLERWFVQADIQDAEGTNLGEAVSFLLDVGILRRDADHPDIISAEPVTEFRLGVLEHLCRADRPGSEAHHPLDPWFHRILAACFVRPNRVFVPQLHGAVNTQGLPVPCSEEKVTAWRRVMEFLGCGRRVGTGFLACYQTELLESILQRWQPEGPLEEFLRFAERYVPVLTANGDMAGSVAIPLQYLENRGRLRMTTRGDFAGRAYLDRRRVKWLTIGG